LGDFVVSVGTTTPNLINSKSMHSLKHLANMIQNGSGIF
jgi:hypothetical protein